MTDWVALKSIPELANAGKNDESAELEVEAVTPPAIPSSAAATTADAASSPANLKRLIIKVKERLREV